MVLLIVGCSASPEIMDGNAPDAGRVTTAPQIAPADGSMGVDAGAASGADAGSEDALTNRGGPDPGEPDAGSPDAAAPDPSEDGGPAEPGCNASCFAKHCGDDGCGGFCGQCNANGVCTAAGLCQCVPSCSGKACGDDGCGGSCGNCGAGTECKSGTCACKPSCFGKQCGGDGCGGSCGGCLDNTQCQGTTCVCLPSCSGKVCGKDGCGGSCGTCFADQICSDGQCQCVPQCTDKVCGSDGCGGTCGSCVSYQSCSLGQCLGWKWEVESSPAIGHDQGVSESGGWACHTDAHSENYMVYGPYLKNTPAGWYTAHYRMMVDNNTAGADKVARIEVYDAYTSKIMKSVNVYRNQFNGVFQYQDFTVSFQTDGSHNLEFRIRWLDTSYVRVDHVTLLPVVSSL